MDGLEIVADPNYITSPHEIVLVRQRDYVSSSDDELEWPSHVTSESEFEAFPNAHKRTKKRKRKGIRADSAHSLLSPSSSSDESELSEAVTKNKNKDTTTGVRVNPVFSSLSHICAECQGQAKNKRRKSV